MINVDKIKINYINNQYWLVPPFWAIFLPSRHKFLPKVFNSLNDLLIKNDLIDKELTIRINGDKEFKHFNKLQNLKNIEFKITDKTLKIIDSNNYCDFEFIPNLIIRLTTKSIISIYKGNIPFYSKRFYQQLLTKGKKISTNKVAYEWTSYFGYKIIKLRID